MLAPSSVLVRLTVSADGVAAELHVGRKTALRGGTTKANLASERYAQRLRDFREGCKRKCEEQEGARNGIKSPPKFKPAPKPHVEPPDQERPQVLFVHFIPPSLRKAGKEKAPWIVHGTAGSPPVCREATHVHFRSVRGFETFEGAAPEQASASHRTWAAPASYPLASR